MVQNKLRKNSGAMASASEMASLRAQDYLADLNYPINKDELLIRLRSDGAPEEVIAIMKKIPHREYANEFELLDEISLVEGS